MFVERDWRGIDGRWFTGGYDEIGIDVQLRRVGSDLTVLGRRPHGAAEGRHRPDAEDLRGESRRPALRPATSISARASRSSAATRGRRRDHRHGRRGGRGRQSARATIVVAGAVTPGALAVYDKVDTHPRDADWNMARVGGVVFPKMLARFDAWALQQRRRTRSPNTADDLKIDAVDATWSIEEYTATLDDDDIKFVGTIDADERRVHAQRRRPESAAQAAIATTSATCGSWPPTRRRAPAATQGPLAPAGVTAALHAFDLR